jgi:hypothetical protein
MIWVILLNANLVVAAGLYLLWLKRPKPPQTDDVVATVTGYSVEVDCRSCGQFNRVPQERLRDKPKCGRCKVRLMPKLKVVLCRVSPMEAAMRADINKVWDDEAKLWDTLADHVILKTKAEKDDKRPDLRVVN